LTCTGPGEYDCLTCDESLERFRELEGEERSRCICIVGKYFNNFFKCMPCDISCRSCEGGGSKN